MCEQRANRQAGKLYLPFISLPPVEHLRCEVGLDGMCTVQLEAALLQVGADIGQVRIAQKQELYYNSGKQNQPQGERGNGG